MDRLPRFHHASQSSSRIRTVQSALPELGIRLRYVEHCGGADRTVFESKQSSKIRFADASRISEHGLEHRLQLTGRTRDDLEHLRGRGLLLQRLGELAR